MFSTAVRVETVFYIPRCRGRRLCLAAAFFLSFTQVSSREPCPSPDADASCAKAALASENGYLNEGSTALLQTRAEARLRVEPALEIVASKAPVVTEDEAHNPELAKTKGLRALAVFLIVCSVIWFCCRSTLAKERSLEESSGTRFASQVWALTWKNVKVSMRTEISLCPCCSTCCVLVLTPVVYVALLTVVPNAIMAWTDLTPDVVINHPVEYGRNYSKHETWSTPGRHLEDYLFQAPTVSEIKGGVSGYAPLWMPMFSKEAPAGSCYCRTVGIVGPRAHEFQTYMERRYSDWQADWKRRHGSPSFTDQMLQERQCPAKRKSPLLRVFESEKAMLELLGNISYGAVDQARGPGNATDDRLCGAVVFKNDAQTASVPKVTVRTNITGMDMSGRVATKRINHDRLGVLEQSASLWWYLRSGFLPLQELAEDFIVDLRLTAPARRNKEFVPLPTDPFTVNAFTRALGGAMSSSGTATIMFAATVMNVASLMIRERTTRQKELMRLMGLFDSSLSFSWVALFSAANFIASIGCTILVYLLWVERSEAMLLFLVIFLCGMCAATLGMIVSTFISTERLGALVAIGIYNLFGLSFLFLTVSSDDNSGQQGFGSEIADSVTSEMLYFFSLFPQVAFTLALQTYLGMDQAGISCNFRTLFQEYNKYTIGGGILMLLLDCTLLGLLFAYLEQVMPHEVGLARPWYFPVDPAFWREMVISAPNKGEFAAGEAILRGGSDGASEEKNNNLFEEESSEQLQQLRSQNLVVTVRGLRKDFVNAVGITVRAVDGLNLTMYQGECFCLLGHNGAGKSTTMAILTGMLPQTSGEVIVFGHRLPQERNVVRSQMGFCMQQNVLWDTLTVEEHIHLFGSLIGLSPSLTASSCNDVLSKVDLTFKRHAEASALSGGMKRKLNVALALLGNSRILFLDEPTAGMDPHTRRQLWEMLKQSRDGRIICLTTHYMDEADELGDRIAIMVAGRAACSGTNAFLKQQLGCGYMINFVKVDEAAKDGPIVDLVRRYCGNDIKISSVGRELRLRVPFTGVSAFPELMQTLDGSLSSLRLESYGVGVSDLEDVFLKVASGQNVGLGSQNSTPSLGPRSADQRVSPMPSEQVVEWQRPEPTFARQVAGLYRRRVRYAKRDSRTFFCQLVLPVFYMVLFLFIEKFSMSANMGLQYPEVAMDTAGWNSPDSSQFGPALVAVGVDSKCASCSELGEAWLRLAPTHSVETSLNDSLSLDEFWTGITKEAKTRPANPMVASHQSQLESEVAFTSYAYGLAHGEGGVIPQVGGILYKEEGITIFPNTTAQYSAPALLNLHYSALIAAQERGSPRNIRGPPLKNIEVTSQPLEGTSIERMLADTVSGEMMGMIVMNSFSFIPAGIAAYVAMERESDVKHQLLVSGTSRRAYWLSNFAFDLSFGIFSSVGALLVFVALGASQWLSSPNIKATLILLGLFNPASALSAYFWSLLFSSSGGAMAGVLISGLVLGSFGLNISAILILFPKTRTMGWILLWGTRAMFPAACLGNGLFRLAMTKGLSDYMYLDPFSGFAFGTEYRFEGLGRMPPVTLAGDDVFMLAVDIVLYLVLLAVLDTVKEVPFLSRFWSKEVRAPAEDVQKDDVVVANERIRVQGLNPASQVLVVDDVHKTYDGSRFAVRGISYAVEEGQVFGLLGVNGAGKTTTFKMMCGQLEPSAGNIFVGGLDVSDDMSKIRKLIGYCPQFNALLDLLTVREHLELYGEVKGLSGASLEQDINEKIKTFDLSKFEQSRAAQLSGGNMRKLSCAIALIGEPPIIFLDEPSSGMDPVARRFMWDVIQDIAQRRRGSAVVLTTHSMEEADALCSRIVIQASGQVKCIGTPQQLKEWYGTGLELNLRLEVPSRQSVQSLCAEWDGTPEKTRDADEAEALASARLGGVYANVSGSLFKSSGRKGVIEQVTLGVLAEWCLVQQQAELVTRFLHERCGGPSRAVCVDRTGRSLSFRLTGDFPGGGPLPYGEIFKLVQNNKEKFGLADFQLSQGTLERTFNRLAAEDLERSEADAEISAR